MAKFYGNIGFTQTDETKPGIWTKVVTEVPYSGEITKYSKRVEANNESLNENIKINVELSILANEFALSNITNISYVEYLGAKWKVTEITPAFPRLRLTLGGVYNGE